MNRRLFLGIGFGVWLLATLAFRVAGHLFFLDDQIALLSLLWLLTVAALLTFVLALFRWRNLDQTARFEAAILLALPGMILDAFAVEAFVSVFPNMPDSAAGSFGAWLLAAYATVLLAAFLPSRSR